MQTSIETLILNNLLVREGFLRKALPFLKTEYFYDSAERKIFELIDTFVEKYNTAPTLQAIDIALQQDSTITENDYSSIHSCLADFSSESDANSDWLLAQTEKFCKDKAVFNAIAKSIRITDGKEKDLTSDAIPSILQDALAVSFNTNVGHDYIEDASARFDAYSLTEQKIPFDLELMNKITRGGIPRKTLNICMAPTGKGKSIFLCHHSANCLTQGLNVLYITMEMAEERIAERIDANLLDISLDDIQTLSKPVFESKIQKLRQKTLGKLIIKEYPTSSAHAGHFRALLSELKIKKNFVPDVVVIDYLNICASSRLKMGNNVNTNSYVKSIAEELRGLAVEQNVAMFSATQTNRGGYDNSDVELTDTAEAIALPQTVDFMFALIQDDEMEKMNQCMFKQLKNRFGKMVVLRRFMVGLDKDKMRFFDLEWTAQKNVMNEDAKADQQQAKQPTFQKTSNVQKNFSGIEF